MNSSPTIAQALAHPANNFTLIRLCLALAVVVSHGFSVTTGQVLDEPLVKSTGFTLGEHAVNGFFAISGFLVTMSFDRRGWKDYILARLLRIAPAFVVATTVVAFVLGAAVTTSSASDYFTNAELWRFVVRTLTEFKSTLPLPGVFAQNPLHFPMGTVWTLKYEVLCYVGVLATGAALLRSRVLALFLVCALAVALLGLEAVAGVPKGIETALRLPFIFALGGAFYLFRDKIRLSGIFCAGLIGAILLARATFLYNTLLFTAFAYATVFLALAPSLTSWRTKTPQASADFSYGTYLYGWPVQQTLTALFTTITISQLLALSVSITLALAGLSWFLIEKPALALKTRFLRIRAKPVLAMP